MGLSISPIFNVVDLYPYQVHDEGTTTTSGRNREVNEQRWIKKMPMAEGLKVESILDTGVAKHTRGKEYLDFLVEWKDHLMEDSTWMSVAGLHKAGCSVEDLISRNS